MDSLKSPPLLDFSIVNACVGGGRWREKGLDNPVKP